MELTQPVMTLVALWLRASLDGQTDGVIACWLSRVIIFADDCSFHGIKVVGAVTSGAIESPRDFWPVLDQ